MLFALLIQASTTDLDRYFDDPRMRGAIVSAYVSDASGKELFRRNATQRLMPGSNQKLLTAAFALHTLGTDFRPRTMVWKQKGRLVIDALGDPTMTRQRLLDVRQALGGGPPLPVYVHSAFGPLWPPGWEWDDFANRYAAKVSAFTVDRGGFELWAEQGRPFLVPDRYGVGILRETGAPSVRYDIFRERITVAGPLPLVRTRLDTLAVPFPDRAAASILGSVLRKTDSVPAEMPTLISAGPPLAEILEETMPSSDNNVFESLLLMASGVKPTDSDPYQIANQKLLEFGTAVVEMPASQFEPYDGSGMSRHNVATTQSLAKLLAWAETQPWAETWHGVLAKPGEGTLKNRLIGAPFEGKTGSLHMVASLTGYLKLDNGKTMIVSVIVNHFACTQAEARDFLDGFMKKVLDAGNRGTLIATTDGHESDRPDPCAASAYGNRLPRFDSHSHLAQPRDDPRDESAHARLHRAERVALRAG